MIDLSLIKPHLWWIAIIVGVVIIIIAAKLGKKHRKPKVKEQDWIHLGYAVVKDRLRLVSQEAGSGIVVHTPIYSLKKWKEIEGQNEETPD